MSILIVMSIGIPDAGSPTSRAAPKEQAGGSAGTQVSVIIAARNAAGTIGTVLQALARQTVSSESYETIVVDDGSSDGTAEIAARFPGTRVVSAGHHVGLPSARNLGIEAARGDLLAFTDDDCVPDPDWLYQGLEHFRGDPELGVLAGRVTITLSDKPSLAELLDAARHLDAERYVRVGFALGCSTWVRAELARSVGGLNEQIAFYGGEDFEFGRLLVSRGAKLGYAPEVHQTHPPRTRLRDLAVKSYRIGKSFSPLRRHSRGPGPPRSSLLRPRHLLPKTRVVRIARLRARGIRPGRWTIARMLVAQYLFLQLPRVAGDAVGSIRSAVGRR